MLRTMRAHIEHVGILVVKSSLISLVSHNNDVSDSKKISSITK